MAKKFLTIGSVSLLFLHPTHLPKMEYQRLVDVSSAYLNYGFTTLIYDEGMMVYIDKPKMLVSNIAKIEFPVLYSFVLDLSLKNFDFILISNTIDICEMYTIYEH